MVLCYDRLRMFERNQCAESIIAGDYGWCNDYHKCYQGNSNGPFDDLQCSNDNWYYYIDKCEAVSTTSTTTTKSPTIFNLTTSKSPTFYNSTIFMTTTTHSLMSSTLSIFTSTNNNDNISNDKQNSKSLVIILISIVCLITLIIIIYLAYKYRHKKK